jgi:hypothetical protein
VPAASLDQASLREFPVGAGDRASGQAEVGRDLPDRRQPLAGLQEPGRDEPGDLLPQLLIRRDRGCHVNSERWRRQA